jgi:hypothetical protein
MRGGWVQRPSAQLPNLIEAGDFPATENSIHPASQLKEFASLGCVLTPLAAKDADCSGWVHDEHTMEPPPDALQTFRRSLYECFHRRSDALFELVDAILTADGTVPSPAHLSLQVPHRRGWGSLYAALWRGRIDYEALRKLLAHHPLAGAQGEPSVYAVDTSVWPRCDAEASPSAATTTILLATPPGSPSSPDGPTSSSHN